MPGPIAHRGRALLPVVLLAGIACGDPAGPVLNVAGDEIIVAFNTDVSSYPADDWDLQSGALDGDALVLTVRYSGGCREHQFWLLAVDDWLPLPDTGPTPTVGVGLRLAHDDGGDACEAVLTAALRFGLGPLRQAYRNAYGPGPARLLLQITDGRDGFAVHVFDWPLGVD